MNKAVELGVSALVTGTVASVVSAATLAALAKLEGRSAAQPLNATSHWLHGDEAARVRSTDVAHTGIGYATHHASAAFWAAPFEAWQQHRPARSTAELLCDAAAMSTVAAFVDYCLMPKRLTPGWEHVLSTRAMLGAFAGLALGLAGGALLSRSLREQSGAR